MAEATKAAAKFARLIEIMATLRGGNGCPWDKAQNEKTILNYFLEEAFELAEAVSQSESARVAEELGDVLMEIVFLARIYEEKGAFSLAGVIEGINQKMTRRHPHVFGKVKLASAAEVKDEWAKLKAREKETADVFPAPCRRLPALLEAFLLGRRASLYKFDWPMAAEALSKVEEELEELKESLKSGEEAALRRELGDLFFSLANVSRLVGINPELALRQANAKFRQRFRHLLGELNKRGKKLGEATLEEMDLIWNEIKDKERQASRG